LPWPGDLVLLVAGPIDDTVSLPDIRSGGPLTTYGKHDDAGQGIYHITNSSLVCSVSYDQTLKVWDLRQRGTAGKTMNLGAKAACSDMACP